MKRTLWCATVLAVGFLVSANSAAWAHAVCGNRVFPATLTMDDPGVGDELSLPTIQYLPLPATGGNPGHSVDYGFEWDKTITRDLGFAINGDYYTQSGASQDFNGWDNWTVTLKDELPCWGAHEFLTSVGVIRNFARTGSSQLINGGVIGNVSYTAPTFYVGKGLGDLPIGYFRPLAITGELGRQFSDSPEVSPDAWAYAASLQYSMPYMQQHVKALNLPAFMGRLIPLVEVSLTNPDSGPTTGTIAPGLLYEGDTWQLGALALIPASHATRQIQGTGFIVQMHFFIDDIFPNSLGKPLIDTDLWQ
ncbi:MAG: hypothetical protein ACREEL_11915 [Stellaceae bacterium]